MDHTAICLFIRSHKLQFGVHTKALIVASFRDVLPVLIELNDLVRLFLDRFLSLIYSSTCIYNSVINLVYISLCIGGQRA